MAEWKETKIGTIPSEWDTKPFEEIIVNGSLSYGVVQPGTHRENNSVPILRVNNIRDGKIFPDDVMKIDKEIEAKYKRTRLEGGELLLTVVGSIGEVAIVPDKFKGWNVARAVSVSRISNEYDKNFIKYCFSTEQIKHQMYSHTNDTVQPTLNLSSLKEIIFPIPPLLEQQAVAKVISSLDEKIDLLHRQNKTLEALAETLFRQWFVEEAEENWETTSLFDVVELVGGGTPKTDIAEYWEGNIKWVSAKDITPNHKKFIVDTEKKITEQGLSNSSARLLPEYATIISARGTVGNYCILSESMAFSQSNYGVKPRFKDCYFFTYLLIANAVEELQSAAYGSVFDTITTSTFKEHQIKIPSEKEVQNFNEQVKPYFEKMLSNEIQICSLTTLRDTLLPKLMSGEVRVKF